VIYLLLIVDMIKLFFAGIAVQPYSL